MLHHVAVRQRICARPWREQESFELSILPWVLRGCGTLEAVDRRDIHMMQLHLLRVAFRQHVVSLEGKRVGSLASLPRPGRTTRLTYIL